MKVSPSSLRSDFARFGLGPSKWSARLKPSVLCPIFSNSIPKSGTHLVESILTAHPSLYRALRPTLMKKHLVQSKGGLGQIIHRTSGGAMLIAHLEWCEEYERLLSQRKCASFFCIRDPRDIVISEAYYIAKNNAHPFHLLFNSVPDLHSRIRLSIAGDPFSGYPSLRQRVEPFLPWLNTEAFLIRFEDLVGDAGGGSNDKQENVVRQMLSLLGLRGVREVLERIRTPVSRSGSPTFRRGRIRQWEEEFDDELMELFKQHAGDLPQRMGYEEACV